MKKLILYILIIVCFIGLNGLLLAQNGEDNTNNNGNQEDTNNNDDNEIRRTEEEELQDEETIEDIDEEIYNILNLVGTRNYEYFYDIPGYLNNAISNAGHSGPDAAKELFRYISREDMKSIVKLINQGIQKVHEESIEMEDAEAITDEDDDEEIRRQEEDQIDDETRRQEEDEIEEEAFDTEEDVQEVYSPGPLDEYLDKDENITVNRYSEEDEKSKVKYLVDRQTTEFSEDLSSDRIHEIMFLIQLTGVNYNKEGFPIRNNKGTYTSLVQTEWMKKNDIYKINVDYLTESLLKGLFNKDPVVRLECIRILQVMGPHPMMLEDVLKASGREVNLELSKEQLDKESSGETVGNIDRAFYLKRSRVLNNKYKYLDLDNEEKIAVPFMEIREFLSEITRVDIVYIVERKEDTARMDKISQYTMNSLTEDITDYLDTETQEEDDPTVRREEEDKKIPLDIYLEGNSAFKIYGATSLISFNEVNYNEIEDIALTDEEKYQITKSFIKGLSNRNYAIRIQIADFLKRLYHSEVSDNEIKHMILIACIDSKEMREALYEEIYELITSKRNRLNDLLTQEEIEKLRSYGIIEPNL